MDQFDVPTTRITYHNIPEPNNSSPSTLAAFLLIGLFFLSSYLLFRAFNSAPIWMLPILNWIQEKLERYDEEIERRREESDPVFRRQAQMRRDIEQYKMMRHNQMRLKEEGRAMMAEMMREMGIDGKIVQ